MPLITVEGVAALTAGLRLHVQSAALPSSLFSLNVPFLHQLALQCATVSRGAGDEIGVALLSLYSTALLALFPVLLQSSLPALCAFLCCVPSSLSSSIASELSHQSALHSTVPAPVVEGSLSPPHSPVSPDSESFAFEADALSSDEDEPTAEDGDGDEGDDARWAEVQRRMEQLTALWYPPWFEANECAPSTLLRALSLADAHAHLFPDTAVLRRAIAPVLSHLLSMRPALLPRFLPSLLTDVLIVPAFALSSVDPVPASTSPTPSSLSAVYLLSHLCSSPLLQSASPSSVFLFRLLRLNLPFLSAHLRWALSAAVAVSERGALLHAVCMLVGFYMEQHDAKRNVGVDVADELIAADVLPLLLTSVPCFHPTLTFACALSADAARLCWQNTEWRRGVQKGEEHTEGDGVQSCVLPVWLALRGAGGPVAINETKAREALAQKASTDVPRKGKMKLTVAALPEDAADAVDSAVLPSLSSPLPSPLLPLLTRSTARLRQAADAAFPRVPSPSTPSSASSPLAFLASVLDSIERAARASPALALLLRPLLHDAAAKDAATTAVHEESQDELLRKWGATVLEVRRAAVEALSSNSDAEMAQSAEQDATRRERNDRTDGGREEGEGGQGNDARRAQIKALVAARRTREQRTAELQRLVQSAKAVLSEGTKKD